MNNDDINNYVPSLLNPRCVRKNDFNISLTQNSVVSRCSLSLKRNHVVSKANKAHKSQDVAKKIQSCDKENNQINQIVSKEVTQNKKVQKAKRTIELDLGSLGFSVVDDIDVTDQDIYNFDSIFGDLETPANDIEAGSDTTFKVKEEVTTNATECISSNTELIDCIEKHNDGSKSTIVYDFHDTAHVTLSFGVINCNEVDITTKNSHLQKVTVTKTEGDLNFDCDLIQDTLLSIDSEHDENMNETSQNSLKRSAVTVNLEIKKKKLTTASDSEEKTKVLILKTNAIEKVSHVILQPPNFKLVKRQISDKRKPPSNLEINSVSKLNNGKNCDRLKQKSIDSYLLKNRTVINISDALVTPSEGIPGLVARDDVIEMSKTSGLSDVNKCDRLVRSARSNDESQKSIKLSYRKSYDSPRNIKSTNSDAHRASPRKNEGTGSQSASPRRTTDSIQFSLNQRKPQKSQVTGRSVPHHKIVAGTHFAVDAFSYGEIPNVKHYFLTHFHSDHYAGLRKGFNKLLICSKITADLCMSRLGVSAKCIHVINVDEPIKIDGVEITPLDANHCPGALMLVFTLPSGKTVLHTGDFRASPSMESYPVFWNREIHTVYLDTTYCNPRYDFPTQDQSLEMALYILRQKKMAVEQAGKSFASVLIVCGTYTIGKERFFIGMSRRVGCSVWACPEKQRVLHVVEGAGAGAGAGGGGAAPTACQLHVVPMRDLTHEKLRSYLDSLKGAFSEVVAFKPSGWENGKHAPAERDHVTIHGIPYSEHSSFSELLRFVKFLKPKQVVPTVDIPGGIKTVQKYFPCPLICKEDIQCQSKVSDYFSIQGRQQVAAVT